MTTDLSSQPPAVSQTEGTVGQTPLNDVIGDGVNAVQRLFGN